MEGAKWGSGRHLRALVTFDCIPRDTVGRQSADRSLSAGLWMQGSVLRPLAVSIVPFDLGEPSAARCGHGRVRRVACAPPGSGWTGLTG